MQSQGKLSIFVSHPSDRLTNCQPDGDGLVAFEFINRLAQRGHTLHVVVESLQIQGDVPENIRFYPANVKTSIAPLRRFLYAIRVRQIFNTIHRQSEIDVIHQLNPVVAGLSLGLVGTGVPIILGPVVASWPEQTKVSPIESLKKFFKYLVKNFLFYCQQQVAVVLLVATPAALNRLYKPKKIAHKIRDLRHGIDDTLFSPNPDLSPADSTPKILFLGGVSYHKGIFTLLKAFEQVSQVLPTCQLIIAGSWGENIEEVKQQISSMSCFSRIKLVGKVARAEVPALMRECTVYCMPSYGEAFGMGALEAMACGKPVVGTDAGGLSYLIPDEGGFKVPPKDDRALANALLKVLSSPGLQAEMGQYNRKLVEKIYSWEQIIEQLETVYYKAIEKNLPETNNSHEQSCSNQ